VCGRRARKSGRAPKRHALLYRILKLLPLEAPSGDDVIAVRRAALYGLSEVERGAVYFEQANRADAADTILRLVRTAHDGDRAFVDDRTMQATAWASDARVDVSDAALERLSAACAALSDADTARIAHDCLLHWQPGSFERSLAAVDERADELRTRVQRPRRDCELPPPDLAAQLPFIAMPSWCRP
jgi:hypothetical protein